MNRPAASGSGPWPGPGLASEPGPVLLDVRGRASAARRTWTKPHREGDLPEAVFDDLSVPWPRRPAPAA